MFRGVFSCASMCRTSFATSSSASSRLRSLSELRFNRSRSLRCREVLSASNSAENSELSVIGGSASKVAGSGASRSIPLPPPGRLLRGGSSESQDGVSEPAFVGVFPASGVTPGSVLKSLMVPQLYGVVILLTPKIGSLLQMGRLLTSGLPRGTSPEFWISASASLPHP